MSVTEVYTCSTCPCTKACGPEQVIVASRTSLAVGKQLDRGVHAKSEIRTVEEEEEKNKKSKKNKKKKKTY